MPRADYTGYDVQDAIGTKRFDSDQSGDREVQRTMLELLNQLDGFEVKDDIKVPATYTTPTCHRSEPFACRLLRPRTVWTYWTLLCCGRVALIARCKS